MRITLTVTNHLQYLVTQKESYLQYQGNIIQRYAGSHMLIIICGQQRNHDKILKIKLNSVIRQIYYFAKNKNYLPSSFVHGLPLLLWFSLTPALICWKWNWNRCPLLLQIMVTKSGNRKHLNDKRRRRELSYCWWIPFKSDCWLDVLCCLPDDGGKGGR